MQDSSVMNGQKVTLVVNMADGGAKREPNRSAADKPSLLHLLSKITRAGLILDRDVLGCDAGGATAPCNRMHARRRGVWCCGAQALKWPSTDIVVQSFDVVLRYDLRVGQFVEFGIIPANHSQLGEHEFFVALVLARSIGPQQRWYHQLHDECCADNE